MVFGIGCDLTEIPRIKKALEQEGFARRVFTEAEQNYCEARKVQRFASYAARFAAKEAFLKAIGTGLRNGKLTEIEVVNDSLGKPSLKVTGSFAKFIEEKGIKKIHLSLSHTEDIAMAQIILEA